MERDVILINSMRDNERTNASDSPFEGKTVIFGVPHHFGFSDVLRQGMEDLGMRCVDVSIMDVKIGYKDVFQRLEKVYHKNFLGKREYKTRIYHRNLRERVANALSAVDGLADYAFIIRPDGYPLEFIEAIRKKTKLLVAYQWDGMARFPESYGYVSLFDRFFVFDGQDLHLSGVLPLTNFCPDPAYLARCADKKAPSSDVFYAGHFNRFNLDPLDQIVRSCESLGHRVLYHLFAGGQHFTDNDPYNPHRLEVTDRRLMYGDYLGYVHKTKVLIDLLHPIHEGLSFRAMEATCLDKKLITNNKRIREYDFYRPANVFVWNGDRDDLAAFLQAEREPLPDSIKKKYGFRNWLQNLLDVGDYQPITLPR